MKYYRSKRGPFQEQPFFEQQEIEDICQEELKKVDLLPASPGPIRIERFIEKRFKVTPRYDELPDGVLGFTRFNDGKVEAIVVSRSLAEEDGKTAERRINSTLAHEAGHGFLHGHLFVTGAQPERLFGDEFDPKIPRILCRDGKPGTRRPGYDGRWWEFQANQTIGALLMPLKLVEMVLDEKILKSVGTLGLRQVRLEDRNQAVSVLSGIFNVNSAVAKIRLDQIFPESSSGQLSL